MKKIIVLLVVLNFGAAIAAAQTKQTADENYKEFVVKEVNTFHGGSGPFAVAGYRMGARALQELNLLKGSFDVDVTHESLPEVGWTCIADGLQAATGASVGKLNLRVTPVADVKAVESVIVNKQNGDKIVFRLTDNFLKRYLPVPLEQLNQAGRAVLDLRDDEIFTIETIKADKAKKPSPFERKRATTKTNQ